jgi:hypothetical protein
MNDEEKRIQIKKKQKKNSEREMSSNEKCSLTYHKQIERIDVYSQIDIADSQ